MNDFGHLLGPFWEAFGDILGSKSVANFGMDFKVVFCVFAVRDAVASMPRGCLVCGIFGAEPAGAAPLKRRRNSSDP